MSQQPAHNPEVFISEKLTPSFKETVVMSNDNAANTCSTKVCSDEAPGISIQMVDGHKVMMPGSQRFSTEKVIVQQGDPVIKTCGSANKIVTQTCAMPSCETVSVPVHRMILEIEIITEQEVCPPTPRPLLGKIREIEYEVPVRNMQPSVIEIMPPSVEITATSQEYTSQETDVISKREIITTQATACRPQTGATVTKKTCDQEGCKIVRENI